VASKVLLELLGGIFTESLKNKKTLTKLNTLKNVKTIFTSMQVM